MTQTQANISTVLLQNWHQVTIRSSLVAFAIHVSNKTWKVPKHLLLLANKLQAVERGEIKRLIVTMPPRHGKSELISNYFPTWYLFRNPDKRIILASYEADFAASWSYKVLQHFKDHQTEFGLSLEYARQDYWTIQDHDGGMNSVGTGGAITGKGADLFIIDDPIKNDSEANSKTYREKTFSWFQSVAYTRLEPNGAIIVVMTRWNEDDLVGRLIKSMDEPDGETWVVLNLPALAETNDPIGREPNEALWAKRYSENRLAVIKKSIGSYWFSALYQQKPATPGSEIIKRRWWQTFDTPPKPQFIVQSWDTAFKTDEKNDFTVGTTWGVTSDGYYLLDSFIDKLEFPEAKRQLIIEFMKWKPNIVIVEDRASGQSLIQAIQRETRIPIKPIKVITDKVTRAHLVTPLFESKRVFIQTEGKNTADIINQCAEFPYSAHDDIVDSITQALNYMKNLKIGSHNGNGHNGNGNIKRDKNKSNKPVRHF